MSSIQRKKETPKKIVKNDQKLKIMIFDSCIFCSFSMFLSLSSATLLRSKVSSFSSVFPLLDEKSIILGSVQTQTFRVFLAFRNFIFVLCFCNIHDSAFIINVK